MTAAAVWGSKTDGVHSGPVIAVAPVFRDGSAQALKGIHDLSWVKFSQVKKYTSFIIRQGYLVIYYNYTYYKIFLSSDFRARDPMGSI